MKKAMMATAVAMTGMVLAMTGCTGMSHKGDMNDMSSMDNNKCNMNKMDDSKSGMKSMDNKNASQHSSMM